LSFSRGAFIIAGHKSGDGTEGLLGRQVTGIPTKVWAVFSAVLLVFFIFSASSESAEFIIIGDTSLRPVNDVVNFVSDAIGERASVYSPQEVRGRLDSILHRERAKVVIALGSDSLGYALSLPESVPIVYGLVIERENVKRRNISGVYMATPVSEYLSYVNRFFPSLRKVGVIYKPGDTAIINDAGSEQLTLYRAGTSFEFMQGVDALEKSVDAILLLPERELLTSTSVEELFRSSFAKKKPVIGVSEKYVKRGALFALVFNEAAMGRQIGEMARKALREGEASGMVPSPPEKFDLYINSETAKVMRIYLPGDLLKRASRVYP
jgi:putative ABC transport system substrate-binding protein